MYLPAPPPLADLALEVTEKQAMMHLEKLRNKSPLPDNVVEANPYQTKPGSLPDGIWFLVCSTDEKKTEFGFWRQKGAPIEIFTDSAVIGWRTTLEFVEVHDAREQRTNWLMLEYKLTGKGPRSDKIEKESRAICRVFDSGGRSSDLEVQPNTRKSVALHKNDVHSMAPVVPKSNTTYKQGSSSMALVNDEGDAKKLISEAESNLDPQLRAISDDDFLELNDLDGSLSRSTSSDNSSRSSLTLEEYYFDSDALLQELDRPNDHILNVETSNSCFSVASPAEPFEIVMEPATSGSLAAGCNMPSSVLKTQNPNETDADHTAKKLKAEGNNQDSSVASSSNNGTGRLISRGKVKAAGVKMKTLKKYFCLMLC